MPTVLITGVGNNGVGSQILRSLRLKAPSDLKIVGCDLDTIYTDRTGLDAFFQVPMPSDPSYYDCISHIIRQSGIELVFVTTLPEVAFFLESHKHLQMPDVRFILPDENLFHLCMDKCCLFRYLRDRGVSVPRFEKITSLKECEQIDYYPVVLKKNCHTGSSDHIFIAFDSEELRYLCAYLLRRNGEVFLQEYIGNEDNEFSISVTAEENGKTVGTIAMQRSFSGSLSVKLNYTNQGIRYPISSGISQGKMVIDETLDLQARHISNVLQLRGSLNIQGKLSNGVLYPFDIHPAITGSVYAKALAGYNEPLYYINRYLNHLNTELSYSPIVVGRKLCTFLIEEGATIAD